VADRVLVLQHHDFADPASLGDWLTARGFEVEIRHADDEWTLPDVRDYAFVVTLGSLNSSYDDSVPWLARELDLLAAAHAAETPVLGICFGGQILARSLGAQTHPAHVSEAAFFEIDSDELGDVPRGPWLFWHDDRFDVPDGATPMGATPAGPAGFRLGTSMGLQFHPEVTPEVMDRWLDAMDGKVEPETRDALQRVAHAEGDRLRQRAWRLYDLFLAQTAKTREDGDD
jgi:GMP synthase-like glutamine amidotransferase